MFKILCLYVFEAIGVEKRKETLFTDKAILTPSRTRYGPRLPDNVILIIIIIQCKIG